MKFAIAASLLLLGSAHSLSVRHHDSIPTARIKNGTLVGIHSIEYNQDFFLGVPYAQPPIGNLRFDNPRSLNETWDGAKSVDEYAKSCVGYGSDQWGYEVSEDCLYLNIVRPSGYEGRALPVAFWIHGGGFYQGGAGDRRYNLSFIVENSVKIGQPIMAVSTNYRLSGWGFLNSNELMGRGLLNIGLKDQRLAMHWVQENIASFGGDPAKVTIWGESAGAASVGFHLTAFGGRDDELFRAAIMQSGNPISYRSISSTDFYQPQFDLVSAAAGCSDSLDQLECLRAVPFEQMNTVLNNSALDWDPAVDGDFIRRYGSIQLEQGEFVKVPIISGANSDEGASFAPQGINTTEDLRASLSAYPPSLVDALLTAYPDDLSTNVIANLGPTTRPPAYPYGLQFRRAASLYGDLVFIAARRRTCSTWAAHGLTAYCYRFNAIPGGIPAEEGVPHFSEVAFVFNNIAGLGYAENGTGSSKPFEGRSEAYTALSGVMSRSWASFVATGSVNGWAGREGLEEWPAYEVDDARDFVWDANVTSYSESDTYRQEGMALISGSAAGVFKT
ncbi:alpha/beta-hydrolase [Pseudovirgaria hyperparasitica]|uniref:Carboxylic ester hydrolase n=1 Tax=Pseudovirgaria hyperparasitica TaxID=470096 RepID=A0A6A6W062_9PEZI|nr:alpha/beta-hydrolase [Pseudovirgaria hyperparasitica]KAF2755374.1 alpha/beta-hydrolase [Pseudovirgaria hyperparasitica]